jgi:hypothetical protein
LGTHTRYRALHLRNAQVLNDYETGIFLLECPGQGAISIFLLSSIRTILLRAGPYEELHFHLFKFAHPKINCWPLSRCEMLFLFGQYRKVFFMREVFCTFKKFTKIPCAVSGRK